MSITKEVERTIRRFGYEKIRPSLLPEPLERRKKLFAAYRIGHVIDVGANTGQYALQLRNMIGFTGRISSFEPLDTAYQQLRLSAAGDSQWSTSNYGLGDRNEYTKINVSSNSVSSSLLPMLPAHVEAAPDSRYIAQQEIEIKTLDSIFPEIVTEQVPLYLKIDTQGFESKVIEGAQRSLARINTVQLEMSLVRLYQDEPLFEEMLQLLQQAGYKLVSVEPGFTDDVSGQLLQLDGIFHRF